MTRSTRKIVSSHVPIVVLAGLLGVGVGIPLSKAQEPTNTLFSEEIQAAIQDAIQQLILEPIQKSSQHVETPAQASEAMPTDAIIKRLASNIVMMGIRVDGSRYRADLVPYRLMQIHDPVRGRSGASHHDGELWAWGTEGRPIAVAEIWRWNQSRHRWGHAMASTTPGRVTAKVGGHTWLPQSPGLEFHSLSEAPTPAVIPQERASQAKQIAKQFSGFEIYRGQRIDLKLQPDPIYHYASDGVSGSIFALVHYDNPEALLFVESVEDPVLPNCWRYAVAQVTSHELHIHYEGQEVVTIPEAVNYKGTPSDPLWVLYVTTGSDFSNQQLRSENFGNPTPQAASGQMSPQENEVRQTPDAAPLENRGAPEAK